MRWSILPVSLVTTLSLVLSCVAPAHKLSLPPASVFTHYTVTELGTLPGFANCQPNAINNRAQIVGMVYADVADGTEVVARPFLWEKGKMSPLPPLGDYPVVEALDISATGVIVGEAFRGEGGQRFISMDKRGVVWKEGKPHELLRLPGYTFLNVYRINREGTVVGVCIKEGTYFAFTHTGQRMQVLRPGMAYDINHQGEVLCRGSEGSLLWRDGQEREVFLDEPCCFASDGHVLGRVGEMFYLVPPGKASVPFVRRQAQLTLTALNTRKQAVGFQNAPEHGYRAVLVQGGKVMDLNQRIPKESGIHLYMAYDLNDQGQVVCTAYPKQSGTGPVRAVLLTPVLEPK